jgi:hypothetical protein
MATKWRKRKTDLNSCKRMCGQRTSYLQACRACCCRQVREQNVLKNQHEPVVLVLKPLCSNHEKKRARCWKGAVRLPQADCRLRSLWRKISRCCDDGGCCVRRNRFSRMHHPKQHRLLCTQGHCGECRSNHCNCR